MAVLKTIARGALQLAGPGRGAGAGKFAGGGAGVVVGRDRVGADAGQGVVAAGAGLKKSEGFA